MPDLKLVVMMLAYWGSHIYPWKIFIRVLNFKPQGNGGKFQRSTKLNLKPSCSLLPFSCAPSLMAYCTLLPSHCDCWPCFQKSTDATLTHTSSPQTTCIFVFFFLILYLLFIPLFLKTWHHWLTAWLLGKGLDFEQSDPNSIFPKACYV